jgi:copper oxidase (laccase) domain-containing protein
MEPARPRAALVATRRGRRGSIDPRPADLTFRAADLEFSPMHLPFEQFPALSTIGICRHAFTQRIPRIDVAHEKAEVLKRLDAAHREIRNAIGIGEWPLCTAEQVHGHKIAVIDSQSKPYFPRLSSSKRGEDQGEEFEPTRAASTLTLPLSLGKGEATQEARSDAQLSVRAEIAKARNNEFRGCDGLITNRRGVALGIYVADCCAVYIVDAKTPAIGLVHSGRKGTELGVVTHAIRQMVDRFGSDPANLIVQLSPCIRPPHYEVDFAAKIIRQCRALGVKEIHDSGICTACNLKRYYSYRAEKGKTGRMLAVLALHSTIAN